MNAPRPNTKVEADPVCLVCQAAEVLSNIDEGRPERNALRAFLDPLLERVSSAMEVVESPSTPHTWEGLVEPLEAASLGLFHAIALFESVHGEEDDPAMSAVGTLLCLAKSEIDAMSMAMVEKVAPKQPHAHYGMREGAQLMINLMEKVGTISDDTCYSFGEKPKDPDRDVRDYMEMAKHVADCLHTVMDDKQHPLVRLGFIRALTHLICVNADGAGTGPEGWDPIAETDFAFSGRRAEELRQRKEALTSPAAGVEKEAEGVHADDSLSPCAKAEIKQMALQVGELADIFQADGRLVDVLSHAAYLYDEAAETPASGVGYELVTVESFLQAALMLATHDQQFANAGLAALLTTIVEKADALSNSFDSRGVYSAQKAKVSTTPAAQSEEVAVTA